MQFGKSRNEVSLHTSVLYKRVCSVSENRNHRPAAIWAHLRPILSHLKELPRKHNSSFCKRQPLYSVQIEKPFLFVEYRNDARYVNILHVELYGGRARKCAADRLGATVKRTTYRIVAFGEDIVNSTDYRNNVSEALQIVRLSHIQ